MRTNEIMKRHRVVLKETSSQTVTDLKAALKESELDGLVRRRRDGRLGWLDIRLASSYVPELVFYPKTKAGGMSLKADGYVYDSVDIRDAYEPVKEGE